MEIYYKSAQAARDAGELEIYRESMKETRKARDIIDALIRERFDGYRLNMTAADIVAAGADLARAALVIAATVRDRAHDGRFSGTVRAWAATVRMPDGSLDDELSWLYTITLRAHSCIVNGLSDMMRKA